MNLKNRILITGGAGYIGSKLSTRLVELGFSTVTDILKYNKNSLSHLLSHKNFNFIHADTRNKLILNDQIKKRYYCPSSRFSRSPLCDKFPQMAKELNLKIISHILSSL